MTLVPQRLLRNLRLARTFASLVPTLIKARPGSGYTVVDAFEAAVRKDPEHPAIVFEDRMLRYREVDAAANRVARWALGEGIRRGDTVALFMENRPEFVI